MIFQHAIVFIILKWQFFITNNRSSIDINMVFLALSSWFNNNWIVLVNSIKIPKFNFQISNKSQFSIFKMQKYYWCWVLYFVCWILPARLIHSGGFVIWLFVFWELSFEIPGQARNDGYCLLFLFLPFGEVRRGLFIHSFLLWCIFFANLCVSFAKLCVIFF
jgi:hypothetical protein